MVLLGRFKVVGPTFSSIIIYQVFCKKFTFFVFVKMQAKKNCIGICSRIVRLLSLCAPSLILRILMCIVLLLLFLFVNILSVWRNIRHMKAILLESC